MNRPRTFAASATLGIGLVILAQYNTLSVNGGDQEPIPISARVVAGLKEPIAVYNNWSAYDELSDDIELTEKLAMKELAEILRLRRAGVRID